MLDPLSHTLAFLLLRRELLLWIRILAFILELTHVPRSTLNVLPEA